MITKLNKISRVFEERLLANNIRGYAVTLEFTKLHEQELTLIAARPGCGKTALALNIAENIAKKGVYTYFVSLEMSKKQLGSRLITSKAGIDSHRIRSGWLEEQDWAKIGQVAGELSKMDMVIDDKSKTIQEVELKACELKESKKVRADVDVESITEILQALWMGLL